MKYLATFLVLFIIYILLAGFVVQEVILGAVVSLVLTLIITKYVEYDLDVMFPVRLVKFLFVYMFVFIWQLLLSNIDVARRVLSPTIPLNPGIVKVKTKIKGDFGKLTLANSITLTPGTLSIDVDGDELFVHTVNVKGETKEEIENNIKEPFEKILGGIFE